jgi:hypothetical protein
MPFSKAKWTHQNAAHMANAKAMWSSRLGVRTTIVLSQTQISRRYEWIHTTKFNIRSLYMNGRSQTRRKLDSTTHINFTYRTFSKYNSTQSRIGAYDLIRNTTARFCLLWKSESALSKLGEAHALLQDCLPSSQPDHKITHVEGFDRNGYICCQC